MGHTATILVIHVKGQNERKVFIEKQLARTGMPYHFIEDGNISDLTPGILDRYFIDNGNYKTEMSCCKLCI